MVKTLEIQLQQILPKPSQISNDIEKFTLSEYKIAINTVLQELTRYPGICFIGQFGSINTPGVSDIDLLIVTEDHCYQSLCDASLQIIKEIPGGAYLFWHPPMVIPLSLLSACDILHSLSNLELLWGNESIMGQLVKPSHSVTFINTMVWNSYFWRTVLRLRGRQLGLRSILLILGNVIQSIAADYRLLGEFTKSQDILKWGKEARGEILVRPLGKQEEHAIDYLSTAIQKWVEADWGIQDLWTQKKLFSQGSYTGDDIFIGRKTYITFLHKKGIHSNERVHLSQLLKDCWRKSIGVEVFALPSFYIEIAMLLYTAFRPGLTSALFKETRRSANFSLDDDLTKEVISYRTAIEKVRQFSKTQGNNELLMFSHPFVLPFGLLI